MQNRFIWLLLSIIFFSACSANRNADNMKYKHHSKQKEEIMEISFPKKNRIPFDDEKMILRRKENSLQAKGDYLLVVKHLFKMFQYHDGRQTAEYFIAIGQNPGDKQAVGDYRTPLGIFPVEGIEDSSDWKHDFNDGKGVINNAYGPWFIRLNTGAQYTLSGNLWTGIGIHGTHVPESIGTRATEGCVRLRNDELIKLVRSLPENGEGTIVEIVE